MLILIKKSSNDKYADCFKEVRIVKLFVKTQFKRSTELIISDLLPLFHLFWLKKIFFVNISAMAKMNEFVN